MNLYFSPLFRFASVFLICWLTACRSIPPPAAYGPIPHQRQLDWQELEFYAFIHFNMNTFTNREWGYGDEDPAWFNPTELDTRQWARLAKEAGMKGIILTAKHHDGFCLWPSAYTEHSVKNSPWRNGQGDLVQELADACREYGLKMGLYLSPWDRNHAQYGSPEYVDYFHNQLRELLTNYGGLFEVWFDGANGGDGYYGGARETRRIDNKTYYQWDKAIAMIRELQPNACIFGDGGPDVRWVGNEEGWANQTNWSLLRRNEVYPGYAQYVELRSGHEDGTHWVPAECDVSIRPGWYYHPYEDHKVKTLDHLVDIYYWSVGRNGSLLLNLPVDDRGLVHEKDAEQLRKLAATIRADMAQDIAAGLPATASEVRGRSARYAADKVTDGRDDTYWAPNDGTTSATLTIDLQRPTDINRILLQEHIPLGQRVSGFVLETFADGNWSAVDTGTTIGYKRIFRFPTRRAEQLRLRITDAKACPLISNIELYHAPLLIVPPAIARDRQGMLSMSAADQESAIYFTLDGTDPTTQSQRYDQPLLPDYPATIRAIAVDPSSGKVSEMSRKEFDIVKEDWQIVRVSGGNPEDAARIMDEDVTTVFNSGKTVLPHETVIDLGAMHTLSGFTYMPMQDRWFTGVVTHFAFYVSPDGNQWGEPAAEGAFDNMRNNPVLQRIMFAPRQGRFIKFTAHRTLDEEQDHITIAELGVITE